MILEKNSTKLSWSMYQTIYYMCVVHRQVLTPYLALIVNGDYVTLYVYFMCFVWVIYFIYKLLQKLQNTTNHTNNNKLLLMLA